MQADDPNRKLGFIPVDVAGYVATGADGKPADRYAALWIEKAGPEDDARMLVAVPAAELQKAQDQLKGAGMAPATLLAFQDANQRASYCGTGRKSATFAASVFHNDLGEMKVPDELAQHAAITLVDLCAGVAAPPAATKERASAALKAAEGGLKAKPDDPSARFARASARLQLGEYAKAIDDLGAAIKKAPQLVNAFQLRAIAHARLGHKDEARADLAQFQKSATDESTKLYLSVIVAAELGEGANEALEKLEAALKSQPKGVDLGYNAACAYSLAAQALGRKDQARRQALADRAIGVLKTAIENGYSDYNHMQEDADLEPIRGLPEFGEIMKAGHMDRSYAAVWSGEAGFEANPIFGLDPAAQLQRCRELASQGYRLVSLSVARTSPDGPPVTASVWHRPAISEQAKDQLAERQARAAFALIRMGKAEEVWPLLRHSPDPRLRSFIINGLNPLGADPKIVAAEFAWLESAQHEAGARLSPRPAERGEGGRRPGEGSSSQLMDATLFQPETSIRRALILALGTYGPDALSPCEREPLFIRLLDLYKNDPDSGIHGAAEWTLRQWNEQAKLKAADVELIQLKDRGDRRWLVHRQGQTFALIEGPVEFTMGSPPAEPDRDPDETPHRRLIPRRFAVAAKEVTVEQYQKFASENPQFGLARSYLDKYSPEPDGPMIGVTWFGAVAYCNWLSKREDLPEDQWCYLRNEKGEYDQAMTIPADVLKRKGYRLPTEAEWEYACRAGAITSRYHGLSPDLLAKYARYAGNSTEHAWPGGSLRPNDLGLFDMLGNVFEWCEDRSYRYQAAAGRRAVADNIYISEHIEMTYPRLLRGGAFGDLPAIVRSAYRSRGTPTGRYYSGGFRPARTYD